MTIPDAFNEGLQSPEVQARWFSGDGTFSNNEGLSTLIYRDASQEDIEDGAHTFERLFRRRNWQGIWHMGGPEGAAFDGAAGGVLVLPAGMAYENLGPSRVSRHGRPSGGLPGLGPEAGPSRRAPGKGSQY